MESLSPLGDKTGQLRRTFRADPHRKLRVPRHDLLSWTPTEMRRFLLAAPATWLHQPTTASPRPSCRQGDNCQRLY